ncbi:MAG: hypothetical protein K8I82_05150 [Anaerolineae bacterium]|nr:hypothetical protein [Anaerolineae bacterium]
MSTPQFSKKEALGHGFYQTQKFIGFILLMGLFFLVVRTVTGGLDVLAGKFSLQVEDLRELKLEKEQEALLMATLVEQEFTTKYGLVKDRLRKLDRPYDFDLPEVLEPKRGQIFEMLGQYRYKLPFPRPAYLVLRFILWMLSILMSIGYIKICLMMSRDEKPQFSELFINVDLLITFILGSLCYGAVMLGGFLLLIVPGIIFAIMFQMYSYLIVDKGLGPIEAMKRSRVITKGSRGNLAVFALLLLLINIAGALCFLVGLVWSIPTAGIAMASVFDRLENAGGSGNLEDLIIRV